MIGRMGRRDMRNIRENRASRIVRIGRMGRRDMRNIRENKGRIER